MPPTYSHSSSNCKEGGPGGEGVVVHRTEDMMVKQGFGSGRFGLRTRSTRKGGSRMGLLLDMVTVGAGVKGRWGQSSVTASICGTTAALWLSLVPLIRQVNFGITL